MERINIPKLENKIFLNRCVLAFIFILILTSILIIKIHNLQIVNFNYYVEESIGNQVRILPIPPIRGNIFDRNNKILATNELAYRLTITPNKIKDINKTLLLLKDNGFINSKDIEQFNKNKKRYKKFHNIPIKHKLSEAKAAELLTSNQFIGVGVESYFHRIYPHNNSSVHTIGYISKMNKKDRQFYNNQNYLGTFFVGKTGIEKQYEELLHGNSGEKQIEKNVSGRIVDTKVLKNAIAGNDLFLTIDIDLQKKAEALLAKKRGSIVAIDVTNGEILILVSSPGYNPNWFVSGISNKNYKILQDSKNTPQLNRSIQGIYPPGSTIKPMIALIGLEENIITKDTKKYCPGYFKLANYSRVFNDWKKTGHGSVDVKDAIAQSCDVFFYSLANKMDIDTIHDNLKNFNFGKKTNIDLPAEQSGILPSRLWKKTHKNEAWYEGETVIIGIGQGFITTTPLQLALASAAIANKGRVYQPKLLKAIKDKNQTIKQIATNKNWQIPIKNIKNWEHVIESMEQTINNPKGTARKLSKGLKYTLAGKTGTAQVFSLDKKEIYIAKNYEEHLRDHALFIGFAPVKNPKIAIAVIVENAGSGSSKAAPIARIILDEYFKIYTTN